MRNLPKKRGHGAHVICPNIKIVLSGANEKTQKFYSKTIKGNGLNPHFEFSAKFEVKQMEEAFLSIFVRDTHPSTTTTTKATKAAAGGAAIGTTATLGFFLFSFFSLLLLLLLLLLLV